MIQDLKNLYHLLVALAAALFFRFPARNLKVIGVTGTDGKTTTASLIYHILKVAGKKASLITSVWAQIRQETYDTGFHVTTPDPWQVQRFLRQAAKAGSEYVVLEVTSHALDQNRVAFCNFLVGVLTNVTHEHLDYHKTYENYVATKAKLLKMAKVAIVNRDDSSYRYISSTFPRQRRGSPKAAVPSSQLITYGIKNEADFTPKKFPFKTKLLGEFNRYNVLAAIACAKFLGIPDKPVKEAILSFKPPVGRLEEVVNQPFKVIIDFAHTPNALENALKTIRPHTKGKIIAVFGCAGQRDWQKRPLMGEISTRLADYTVITAEDPRMEDLGKIMEQIAQGCRQGGGAEGKTYFKVAGRQEAINFAIQKLAKVGDLVIICGKAHEKSMCFGKKEYPWSDHEAVKKALEGYV